MLTREDWNEYAGCPNKYWAGRGDRILHEEIPEQVELFWNEFFEGKGGRGFRKLDCEHNRELLLQKYRNRFAHDLVVRSALNNFWYQLMISFAEGFTDPNAVEEEVVEEVDSEAVVFAEFEVWSNAPDTNTKMIADRRRADSRYAKYYNERLAREIQNDDPMADVNARNNIRQPLTTPTSRRVASPEVQRFAADYRLMSSEEVKRLLSPGLNPLGSAAAEHSRQLFDQACAYGLI